jgi:acetyl-CoA synthetase
LQPLLDEASDNSVAEIMDSEDPLFILYTSGSTGKPKGWFTPPLVIWFIPHTFKNVFNYEENDIFWCDIGWITGHSYILYGLIERATTVIFEGYLRIPDFSRFGKLSRNIK